MVVVVRSILPAPMSVLMKKVSTVTRSSRQFGDLETTAEVFEQVSMLIIELNHLFTIDATWNEH